MSTTAGTIQAEYLVSGMTCGHCVASVTEEIGAIAGVGDISVALEVGGLSSVVVTSADSIPVEDIRAAVAEAGYSLVESTR